MFRKARRRVEVAEDLTKKSFRFRHKNFVFCRHSGNY